ncbi:hypothetical protein RN001_013200 [Aquatica leii]|uniref:phospholipase A2 n=1 Tax=Aquatica leii TaxID=1421715 RepID=A0AAN7SNM5_9COLE|nr:hypothetical protein RN001_013200 [Aquatica leii]
MAISWHKFVIISGLLSSVVAVNFTNFIATNVLPDGEVEVRIRYRGQSAKETSVSAKSKTKITLRQLTDGKHFIQLIYDDRDNILDCEYLHQKDEVELFEIKFDEDINKSTSNLTIETLDNRRLPENIRKWFNFSHLRNLCRKNHKRIKKTLRESEIQHGSMHKRSRKTRAISDYLIAPGTLWCGYQDKANSYTELGGMSLTDKCCRRHDHCKMNIHGFSRKYNYYNAKPFTLSHCFCDSSFRACLKMADTSDANLVGKLFFNIVQTKCFVLKPRKYCAKRSWWGKCTKTKYTKHAIIRDNLSY